MDQLLAASSALCHKEGDYYVGFETPLEGAAEISQCTEDLKVFHAESIPMIEDLGKLLSMIHDLKIPSYTLFIHA